MVISYRGGPECYILVESRGRSAVFTGDTALIDVLQEVCQRV